MLEREQSNWCLTGTKEDLFSKRKRIFEVDPIASTALVFTLIGKRIGWPHNEDVGDTALVVMLFELIGLKIIFDVDLRDAGKTPRWDSDILSRISGGKGVL